MEYQIKDSAYTLTPEQIRSLIDSLPKFRDRLIIKLFAYTALRREELGLLKLSDVDFEAQTILVTGKGKKIRQVPVSRAVMNDIRHWVGKRFMGFLFPSRYKSVDSPMRLCVYNNICRMAGKLAGIKNPNPRLNYINPHLFRHSYARIAKDRGMPYEALQNIMGHASFVTTMDMYGTMSLQDIKKNTECMAHI